ncbi:MAG: amidohydrolase [Flavobacteriaceae bacterium]
MKFIHKVFLIIAALAAVACQPKIDLLVHNAQVYTVNEEFELVSAFAVHEGKFIAVGGEELLDEYDARNVVNAQQLPIFPGFIDAHCHFLNLGLTLQQIDLVGTKSFDEVIQKTKKFVADKQPSVIRGRGWDQNDWEDQSYPTKERLDQLFPDTPVVLERIDGHAYLVNQKALDLAGITAETEVPGGTIIINQGVLTGVLVDAPMALIDTALPEPTREEKIKAFELAQNICTQHGLTTVDDAGLLKDDILLLDSLQKANRIQLRVYAMISNDSSSVDYFLQNGRIRTSKLHVNSVKLYADGALGSRGAALKEDYSDQPNHRGKFVTAVEDIEVLARKLAKSPFQLNTHAIGDAANAEVLRVYNEVLGPIEDPRWRIEHAQIVDPSDWKGFGSKVIPSVQPTHATSDMYWAEQRLGKKRMSGAYAFKQLLDWSGTIALGTDFPVEEVSPMKTFYAAISRKDAEGYPVGGFQMQSALSRLEALKGMTSWAAYANFEEDVKGSIEVGKYADFVILDRDIMTITPDEILQTTVVATILNGNIVFSNRFN